MVFVLLAMSRKKMLHSISLAYDPDFDGKLDLQLVRSSPELYRFCASDNTCSLRFLHRNPKKCLMFKFKQLTRTFAVLVTSGTQLLKSLYMHDWPFADLLQGVLKGWDAM